MIFKINMCKPTLVVVATVRYATTILMYENNNQITNAKRIKCRAEIRQRVNVFFEKKSFVNIVNC